MNEYKIGQKVWIRDPVSSWSKYYKGKVIMIEPLLIKSRKFGIRAPWDEEVAPR